MTFNDNKAIYLQIADKIMDEVVTGIYLPGQRIPSVREYAASVEVNANTVMRSFEMLERAGIIFNRRGIGFFVAENAVELIMDTRRSLFYAEEIQYFFNRLKSFGITPEQLASEYLSFISKSEK